MDDRNSDTAEGRPDEKHDQGEHESAPESQNTPRLLRQRAARIVVLVCTLLLAFIVLLAGFPPLRDLALNAFSHPTATALPAGVASQRTATAEATIWTALEQRPLHLPVLAPGSACPVTPGRRIDPAYGPAAGTGPAYAVGIGTDGVRCTPIVGQLHAHTTLKERGA